MYYQYDDGTGALSDTVEEEISPVTYDLPKILFERPISNCKSSPSLAATVTTEQSDYRDESDDTISTCSMVSALTSHSTILNTSKNFRVITRVRPLSPTDVGNNIKVSIKALEETSQIEVGSKHFSFDAVYGPESTQSQVYKHGVSDLVPGLLSGMNATVLAYGHTGSGKTHTIFGGSKKMENSDGILHRAVFDLFESIKRSDCRLENVEVTISCLEIYNEEIKDLISPQTRPADLVIRVDKKEGIYIQNLSHRQVKSHYEVFDLLKSAREKRATASTSYNTTSSRSHAICTLNITACLSGKENYGTQIKSKLTFVDLAGSERVNKAEMERTRMKEGININKSLLVLGQVLSTLSEIGKGQNESVSAASTHVKYRDSKLTRILQEVLEGNSKTVMVACVASTESSGKESTNTLRYAENARNIKIKPVKNIFMKPMSRSEIEALLKENHQLKMKVEQMETELSAKASNLHHPTADDWMYHDEHEPINNSKSPQYDNTQDPNDVSNLKAQCLYLQHCIDTMKDDPITSGKNFLSASHRADKWQMYAEELMAIMKAKGIPFPENLSQEGRFQSLYLVNDLRKEILHLRKQLECNKSFEMDEISSRKNIEFSESFDIVEEDNAEDNESLPSQLVELNDSIELKESSLILMQKERKCMLEMRSYFESAIHTLQDEIETLCRDRDSLQDKIKKETNLKDNPNVEKMRDSITSMQDRIKELRKKTKEHEKCLRLQMTAESKCDELEIEVKEDRRKMRELQRKLKEESRERRHANKTALITAVKMECEKNRIEYKLNKVREVSAKKEAVLRRKATDAMKKQQSLMELNKKLMNEKSSP